MKQLCKLIFPVILVAFLLLAGNLAYATYMQLPDTVAIGAARLSYVMHDAKGEIYNLYIIGAALYNFYAASEVDEASLHRPELSSLNFWQFRP